MAMESVLIFLLQIILHIAKTFHLVIFVIRIGVVAMYYAEISYRIMARNQISAMPLSLIYYVFRRGLQETH